ncbi:MAG TPA: DUF934 domain-containing protein [Alphaproteobacteria bacterium]|nr:DUF934 domain-containing protein [Alphaproteobacteria bacterium]
MALLEAAGRAVEDIWTKVDDDAPLPAGPALISFARLERDKDLLAARDAPLGIIVSSKTKPEDLAPYLDRASLVAIQFPVSKDGRGFTIARALRERFGYKGEIRAIGHVLPDQYVHLLRVGFSNVEVRDGTESRWREALSFYDVAYQPAITDDHPLSLMRRRLADTERR